MKVGKRMAGSKTPLSRAAVAFGEKDDVGSRQKNFENNEGVWSKQDIKALQKYLKMLECETKFEPFTWSPDVPGLLCTSAEDVFDRTVLLVSTVNLVASLMLSATAGTALNPIDVEAMPDVEWKRTLADVFNILTAICVTIQICNVVFSAYVLIMLAGSSSNPSLIYRSLSHSGPCFAIFQINTYVPNFMLLAMMVIMNILRCRLWARWIAVMGIVVVYAIIHFVSMQGFARMFPASQSYWAFLTAPWNYLSPRFVSDARRNGAALLLQAETALATHLDSDGIEALRFAGISDKSKVLEVRAREGRELSGFLKAVLPRLSDDRRNHLAGAFIREELTLTTLVGAAKAPGAFMAVVDQINLEGLELLRGERLALVTALINCNKQDDIETDNESTGLARRLST
mmetsp:Transcript_28096/g.53519  ORF Transcript_28096/g.53519 Transcript_28096/m.53519 type:complete len:401 (+) Transcript_28096:421-1623(+)|eukprot:CAMPEP_0114237798 /NCGR_PEP_ID=MMETSP0058-20121206/7583_1 /TAXON_ID=36894 /ORGANISM="Pyramimonas parkeae, CCMP726" /LENGTH=400 /DNA_ID=CAMNT_0001349865 /DNA_START=338 /DNA_END=1540 /DNA_ORIENTATION=-